MQLKTKLFIQFLGRILSFYKNIHFCVSKMKQTACLLYQRDTHKDQKWSLKYEIVSAVSFSIIICELKYATDIEFILKNISPGTFCILFLSSIKTEVNGFISRSITTIVFLFINRQKETMATHTGSYSIQCKFSFRSMNSRIGLLYITCYGCREDY